MLRHLFFVSITLLCLSSCYRAAHPTDAEEQDDTLAVVTSIYDDDLYHQRRTEACWIYAMLACIEREQYRKGDSVALSRQWLMARSLEEQTTERYLLHGDDRAYISMRGVGPEALRLICRYGLVPRCMERSRVNNSHVLQRKLTLLADTKNLTMQQLMRRTEDLLPQFTIARREDNTFGESWAEASFFFYSMRYTAKQFAESIMYDQHWQWYASSEHHPWHERFALEVPDNRHYHEYTNLPKQELLDLVLASLRAGHPVYWEKSHKKNTGASDHAVAIIKVMNCKDGKQRLLCLNSYGKKWGRNGYFLVSIPYFLSHTSNVGVLK